MSAKKQTFEMKSPKERHLADREWVGGATPFLKKGSDTFKNFSMGWFGLTFLFNLATIIVNFANFRKYITE